MAPVSGTLLALSGQMNIIKPVLMGVLAISVTSVNAGTANLDVPFVPTPQPVVDEMLKMAKVSSSDYVIDLGSGDGRIVIAAAERHGARGMGVDLNPERVAEAEENARRAGVASRAKFIKANLFETEIAKATVITMYLLPSVNIEIRPRLLSELKPGTRVVSHDFDMGEWKPDHESSPMPGKKVYGWVVPARVDGRWEVSLPDEEKPVRMTLKQEFQEIKGTIKLNGREVPLENASLNGGELSFALETEEGGRKRLRRMEGKVIGDRIEADRWSAKKK